MQETMATKTKTTSDTGFSRVLAYHGADDALKRKALEQLASELVDPDLRDFDYETLYGPDLTSDRVIASAGVVPFASARRLVVVTQANEMTAAEQELLARNLNRVPETTCLVLMAPAPELKEGKPKRGSELHPDLMRVVKKLGKAVDFPLMKAQDAPPVVRRMVESEGKTISLTSAMAIVRRAGTDTGILASEVRKLADYVGYRKEITAQDVEAVTTQTLEEKIFALTDAVGSKKPVLALQQLHPLLHDGSSAQGDALRTLSMLARHFRELWQVRVLVDAGCKALTREGVPEYLQAMLPSNNILGAQDWKMRKLREQAPNFSVEDLADCFERIAAVDLAIKGIDGDVSDAVLAMEMLIVELSTTKKGRR
jgi:DNA polymerase III subunit delta